MADWVLKGSLKGPQGDPGQDAQFPAGGTEGQVLTKTADGEAWQDAPEPDLTGMATFKSIAGGDVLAKVGEGGQEEFVPQLMVVPSDYDPSGRAYPINSVIIRVDGDTTALAMLGKSLLLQFGGKEIREITDNVSDGSPNALATAKAVKDYADSVGVPDGGTPGQLLSKTDSGTAWVDPPFGNVLTGEATGYVAHAEDAYAQKPREVRIKGKTWKNLWPVINGSSNGVTVSTDETGLITLSGTATADATITAEAAYAPSSAYVMASTYGTPSTWHIVNGETQVTSGTQLAAPSATCGVVVKSGTTVNASLRVMLVEGDTAPDCFVHTSLHSVGQLREDEKNLWVNPTNRTVSGVTLTNNGDGSLTVSGTNTASGTIYMGATGPFALEAGKTYTISIDGNPAFSAYVNFRGSDNSLLGSKSVGASNGQSSTTFSPSSSTSAFQLGISVQAGVAISGTYHVMLNEGSTAQPWVAPGTESEIRVMMAGKNLLNEGAPTAAGVVGPQLPPGDYALSGKLPSGASLRLLNGGADGETITDASSLPHSFTASYPFTPYYAGVGGYATNLQLELGSTATAYEPPNVTQTPLPEVELRGLPNGTCDELIIAQDGTATVERRTQLTGDEVTALPEPTTESLGTVSLPVLPAPTFNVWHDSDVPSVTTVTYERDVHVALDKLQAQVSATTVREATNG